MSKEIQTLPLHNQLPITASASDMHNPAKGIEGGIELDSKVRSLISVGAVLLAAGVLAPSGYNGQPTAVASGSHLERPELVTSGSSASEGLQSGRPTRKPKKRTKPARRRPGIPMGPTEVLPLMNQAEADQMVEILTNPSNDPELEAAYLKKEESIYNMWVASDGKITRSPTSRYRALLDPNTPANLKDMAEQVSKNEANFWERQRVLSKDDGYTYVNPAEAIEQILAAETYEDAVNALNNEVLNRFGTMAVVTDDVSVDKSLKHLLNDRYQSRPFERSPKGLERFKIGLILSARGLAVFPLEIGRRASFNRIHLVNDYRNRPGENNGNMVRNDGSVVPMDDAAGEVHTDLYFADLSKGPKSRMILDLHDAVPDGDSFNGEVDFGETLMAHEWMHGVDMNGFDEKQVYREVTRRFGNVLINYPTVRYLNSSASPKRVAFETETFSESIGWRGLNPNGLHSVWGNTANVFTPDVFTTLYGSNNPLEDIAESVSGLLTSPSQYIYRLSYNRIPFSDLTGEVREGQGPKPVDLKRLSFMHAVSNRNYTVARPMRTDSHSFARHLRERNIVFLGGNK